LLDYARVSTVDRAPRRLAERGRTSILGSLCAARSDSVAPGLISEGIAVRASLFGLVVAVGLLALPPGASAATCSDYVYERRFAQ